MKLYPLLPPFKRGVCAASPSQRAAAHIQKFNTRKPNIQQPDIQKRGDRLALPAPID